MPTIYEKEFERDKVGQALGIEFTLLKDKMFRSTNFKDGF